MRLHSRASPHNVWTPTKRFFTLSCQPRRWQPWMGSTPKRAPLASPHPTQLAKIFWLADLIFEYFDLLCVAVEMLVWFWWYEDAQTKQGFCHRSTFCVCFFLVGDIQIHTSSSIVESWFCWVATSRAIAPLFVHALRSQPAFS